MILSNNFYVSLYSSLLIFITDGLEQKSAFRILWTEEGDKIVVWFVAKHKEVSRLMKLIDDAKSRTARQQVPESLISELRNDELLPQTTAPRSEVLLDVCGNVPLKCYDVMQQNISDISLESWTPKLHLSEEERDVVEQLGTILVLGRSGTGKTVCICNRMEWDRQKFESDVTFSQLFVARSKRLCRYVSEVVGIHDRSLFNTFDELMNHLESSLPNLVRGGRYFLPSQRVDFHRFKLEFHTDIFTKEKKIDALTVWTGRCASNEYHHCKLSSHFCSLTLGNF